MIKKLSDGPVVMTVQSASLTEGNYGTQIQFVGQEDGAAEDTVLYIAERSAARQLERLSLSTQNVAGVALRFEQVQKDGRTYNNIYRADPGQVAAAPAPAAYTPPAATPPAPAAKVGSYDLYAECLQNAASMVLAMGEETGVQVSGSDIVAAAATLFIQASRR